MQKEVVKAVLIAGKPGIDRFRSIAVKFYVLLILYKNLKITFK